MKERLMFVALLMWPLVAGAEPAWHSAHVRIEADIDRVVQALERPCEVLHWMPDLETVHVLERSAPGQTLVYMRSHAPWPFKPRDAVLAFTRETRPGHVLITMRARPDALPPVDGHVRIPASDAQWSLLQHNGTTLVDYRSRVEPGGQVPQWLSDRFARSSVQRAVTALRDHILEYDSDKLPAGCATAEHSDAVGGER